MDRKMKRKGSRRASAAVDWFKVDWRRELKNNVTTLEQLKEFIPLSEQEERDLAQVMEFHPLNIPRYYLNLVDPDDPEDPIRRMCVPDAQEMIVAGAMGATTDDPYGDDKHDMGGVLHKYDYSVLVVTSEYCAMYCRHCFRRRMVGLPTDLVARNFENAAKYIAEHPSITNVVMSGGDPLMLPTPTLKKMLNSLRNIEHLNYIRLGTRIPVSYPMRLNDPELLSFLEEYNREKTLFVPTHFNHVREITPESTEAVWRLRSAGMTVNNQAVLLRGVNDSVEALVSLMNGLLRIGVSPYYLYQCMPVERVRHHFQVPLKRGIDLVDQARLQFDGYAKRFRFIMGHDIGKLEICGRKGNILVLKQIHARIGHEDEGSRIMFRLLNDTGGWLEDFPEILPA